MYNSMQIAGVCLLLQLKEQLLQIMTGVGQLFKNCKVIKMYACLDVCKLKQYLLIYHMFTYHISAAICKRKSS